MSLLVRLRRLIKPKGMKRLKVLVVPKRYNSTLTLRRLENKTAVITGAGSGFGRETTKLFLDHGAKVIGIDYNKESLDKLQKEFKEVSVFYGDVSKEEDVVAYTKAITAEHKQVVCLYLIIVCGETIIFYARLIHLAFYWVSHLKFAFCMELRNCGSSPHFPFE